MSALRFLFIVDNSTKLYQIIVELSTIIHELSDLPQTTYKKAGTFCLHFTSKETWKQ